MTYFTADDGEQIQVHVSGEGPALVFLHGWTASHLEWSVFMRALNPHFRIFRWDARCRGDQPSQTTTPPTVERMARDLENLLDHFHLEQAIVVGHSMGALTLWQYIQDFGTKRLAKVCFIDQSPKLVTDSTWRLGIYGDFDEDRSQEFIRQMRVDFAENVVKLVVFGLNQGARESYLAGGEYWENYRQHLRALNPSPLITCWESLTRADYRPVLARIDVPTLLVYGSESNFYVPETAAYVSQRVANAVLHIYEGEDHSPHIWQRNRFVRDLREFCGV